MNEFESGWGPKEEPPHSDTETRLKLVRRCITGEKPADWTEGDDAEWVTYKAREAAAGKPTPSQQQQSEREQCIALFCEAAGVAPKSQIICDYILQHAEEANAWPWVKDMVDALKLVRSLSPPEGTEKALETSASAPAQDAKRRTPEGHFESANTESPAAFVFSPDYRSVRFRGASFSFTSRQAQVIEMLHKAYKQGTPELGKEYIFEQLGERSIRLRDTFKNHGAWKVLIVDGKRRGTYRLDLPDPQSPH